MKSLFVFFVILVPLFGFSQQELQKQTLLEGKLEMLVPTAFHKMTEQEYKKKYPNPNRKASLILTDSFLEVNVIVNHMTQYDLPNDQIEPFRDSQLESLKKAYPSFKLIEKNVKEVNGKTLAFFKAITPATDQNVFLYFAFTNLQGKILMFSFNCIEKLQATWETPLDKMIGSIKTNE